MREGHLGRLTVSFMAKKSERKEMKNCDVIIVPLGLLSSAYSCIIHYVVMRWMAQTISLHPAAIFDWSIHHTSPCISLERRV